MEEINILNKRVLYIGPTWFQHDQFLMNKLTELGAVVESFRVDMKESYYFKIIKKLSLAQRELYEFNYYSQLLQKKYSDYDYVLIRQGFQLGLDLINKLRIANPNAKFINFQWDSLKPSHNHLPIINYFDKVFSFDYKDCQNHSKIEYLPLFYIDKYAEITNCNFDNKEIDVLFVGAWRDMERYNLIRLTKKLCIKNNLRFYYYLHSSYGAQYYFFRDYRIIQKEAKLKLLSQEEIVKLCAISKTVIDLPSSFQTGLTIRCFETLAAGLKLITTNTNIINEPFMNLEFINIIDKNNLTINVDFIKNKPTSSMKGLIENYSIGNYINKLLQ